jgi:peptide/nickel transport system substrate-binding protein
VEPNEDFTKWTVKIREGIKFTDGTPYDAEAVAFGINRHRAGQPTAPPCEEVYACPRNTRSTGVLLSAVESIEVIDDLTLEITLSAPDSGFPFALASEAGMIPSPTAIREQCDPAVPPIECSFSLKPVGAGPFMVESFKAKESVTLVRNPDYWGGEVYLDKIEFTSREDAGGAATYDAFRTGQIQSAILSDQAVIAQALEDDGVDAFVWDTYAGRMILLNMGATVQCAGGQPAPTCTGKPDGPAKTEPDTANLKVRQAVAYAIDPKIHSDRVYGGKANPTKVFFNESFPWYPDVDGLPYDVEKAKQLVEEAKAEGWDGTLTYYATNAPFAVAEGQALQAMLAQAGIELIVDNTEEQQGLSNRVIVTKDFDIAGWGMGTTPDAGGIAAVAQNFLSTSSSNRVGYANPEVDAAIAAVKAARNDAERVAAYRIIAEHLRDDVPAVPLDDLRYAVIMADNLHGVKQNTRYNVLLHEAWLEP